MDRTLRNSIWQAKVLRVVAAGLGMLMLLASCGGSTPSDLGAFGIDGDDFSGTFDGASVGMGDDLDRPEWLESWFELPAGLEISMAIADPSTGERVVQGVVAGSDEASVLAQQRVMLEAAGYEALADSGYFVQAGQTSVQIVTRDFGDGTVGYVYETSFESEQTLRDVYAPIEGNGTMTVSMNDEVLSFEGECRLTSRTGSFNGDSGQKSLTVEQRDGEQDYILGNVINADGDAFEAWSVLQVTDTGEYPTISVNQDGFQLVGFMVDSSFSNPTPVTMDVRCPG